MTNCATRAQPEPLIKGKRDKERVSALSARIVEIHRGILDGSDGGEEASCAQVDRNEASDIKLAPVPVDISIYLYLLTSNMCNVPAPLRRRRHDGGTGTPPFSRLRCSAARERVRVVVVSLPRRHRRAPSNPRRWCNTQRLLCDITCWPRASVPTGALLSPTVTIKTDTTNADERIVHQESPPRPTNFREHCELTIFAEKAFPLSR